MPLFCPDAIPGVFELQSIVLLEFSWTTAAKPTAGGTPLFYPRSVRDRCDFSPRGDL